MRRRAVTSALMLVVMTLLTGVAYPLVITGVAQALFHRQANGSLVTTGNTVVGSELIGQDFVLTSGAPDPRYFQGRPSASNYNALASGGSNLGPSNPVLLSQVRAREAAYRRFNDLAMSASVPVDAVTASASGLDPDISMANALDQAPRVAADRGLPVSRVLALIAHMESRRALGILGQPVVNVLMLNRALDASSQG